MNSRSKEAIRILAHRINKDPTSANMDDLKKLAKAVLMLLGENVTVHK